MKRQTRLVNYCSKSNLLTHSLALPVALEQGWRKGSLHSSWIPVLKTLEPENSARISSSCMSTVQSRRRRLVRAFRCLAGSETGKISPLGRWTSSGDSALTSSSSKHWGASLETSLSILLCSCSATFNPVANSAY